MKYSKERINVCVENKTDKIIKTITMQYMVSQSRVNQIKNRLIPIRTVSNIENGTSIVSKSSHYTSIKVFYF